MTWENDPRVTMIDEWRRDGGNGEDRRDDEIVTTIEESLREADNARVIEERRVQSAKTSGRRGRSACPRI